VTRVISDVNVLVIEMSIVRDDGIHEIWEAVRLWPPPMRLSLASKILQSLEAEQEGPKKSLRDIVGILATDRPPPTDEEVQRILDEERMVKYG